MDFIVTSLIALGLAWVTVNILVGVAMFCFTIIYQFYCRMVPYITTALTVSMNTEHFKPGYARLKLI